MVVLSTSKEIENLKHPRKSKNPKFQFSKIPIFQKKTKKPKKTKKNNSAQTMGGRGGEAKSWHNWFFWFLWFFWKIGILENWNFGKLEFWKIGILENWNFGNCLWGRGGVEAE